MFIVCGRGQLHLTVLIENMRREGFELMVGPPTVIDRVIDGVKCEPFEQVDVTVPNDYSSAVVDMLNKRKGEMLSMGPAEGMWVLPVLLFSCLLFFFLVFGLFISYQHLPALPLPCHLDLHISMTLVSILSTFIPHHSHRPFISSYNTFPICFT